MTEQANPTEAQPTETYEMEPGHIYPVSDADPAPQEEPTEDAEQAEEKETPQDDLPEKYQGKTAAEIAQMHMEAEKALGRQSGELGDYRKMFDAYVQQSAQPAASAEKEVDLETELYADPKAFAERIKEEAKQDILKDLPNALTKHDARSELDAEFPDRLELTRGAEFQAWLSSNIPPAVVSQGETDPSVALWVLRQYKGSREQGEAQAQAKENQGVRRRTASQVASVPSGTKSEGKKTYTRAEIMDMIRNNPKRYEDELDAISAAYRDGRVKN